MSALVSLPRVVQCVGFASVLMIAAAAGTPAAAQEGDGLIPHGDWTDEQVAFMHDLIDRTEEVLPETFPVTASFDELDATLGAMGFFNFGATAPGGYDHWINPGWVIDDRVIDPEFSESLVYQQTGDGNWQLVSAMFMLNPSIGMDEIPHDIAWLPGWHGHPELCVGGDGGFAGITDPEDPNCPPGTSQATTPLMMHVWIVDNDCNHRFGGVGVSGLHCSHEGHEGPGHEEPGHEEPGHEEPGHEEPGHEEPGHEEPGHEEPGHDHTPAPVAPPAEPVAGQPTFTG
jgi:hypothetical protein